MTDKQFLVFMSQIHYDIRRIYTMIGLEELTDDKGRPKGVYECVGDINLVHVELEQLLYKIDSCRKILGSDKKEGK